MISFIEVFTYLSVGLAAGFLSGLLGVGGGLIVVPALLAIFHFLEFPTDNIMQMAVGTSLAAMIFTSGASAWAHRKGVNRGMFRELALGVCIGAFLGAVIAHLLPTTKLQVIFGIFISLFGIYFLVTANTVEHEGNIKPPHYLIMSLLGLVTGLISSILGIGGGIITVPMLAFFGVVLRQAISTSAWIGFLIAMIGGISFFYLGRQNAQFSGYVYIPAFILVGLAATLTAPLGAKYAYTSSSVFLKRVFGIYQILVGIIMIIFV